MYRKKFQVRDIDCLLDEIEQIQNEYGVERIFFIDLEFILPGRESEAISFCKKLIERDIKLEWAIQTRVDSVNEQVLGWLKKAGCVLIHYGVESGNAEVLESTNKKVNLSQIEEAFKLTHSIGIKTLAFFTIGHPEETAEQIQQTVDFAKRLNPDYASFVIAIPFVGTKIHDKERGQVYYSTCNKNISAKDLESMRKKAISSYYFRPKYIFTQLLRLRSFSDFMVLVRGFFQVFIPLLKS